ncbi:Hyaluronan/mRNA-binding protein [Phytophthora cactorum]|nr:Hyaluronan/mRNA-binding protein [Phytophthora cactorum]
MAMKAKHFEVSGKLSTPPCLHWSGDDNNQRSQPQVLGFMQKASKYQNFFAALDSDDEDTPRVNKKATPPPSAPVTLNKPAAGNKKSGNKKAPVGDKKESRGPREGGRAPRERGERGRGNRGPRREHERRSGTGRGKETSKQGGGARNWGNKADPNEQLLRLLSRREEVQLTLDEYLAKQKSSRSGELFADVEVRQVANEFSSAVQITKEGKTPDFMDSQYEKVYSKKTSGRKKQVITDVGFRSEKPERFTRDLTRRVADAVTVVAVVLVATAALVAVVAVAPTSRT